MKTNQKFKPIRMERMNIALASREALQSIIEPIILGSTLGNFSLGKIFLQLENSKWIQLEYRKIFSVNLGIAEILMEKPSNFPKLTAVGIYNYFFMKKLKSILFLKRQGDFLVGMETSIEYLFQIRMKTTHFESGYYEIMYEDVDSMRNDVYEGVFKNLKIIKI